MKAAVAEVFHFFHHHKLMQKNDQGEGNYQASDARNSVGDELNLPCFICVPLPDVVRKSMPLNSAISQ